MNREFLKEQGLTDEQIESVMKEHGKTINDTKKKADKADTLESQIEDYKNQLEERDNQLEELKKVDADGLKAKIDELQTANETQQTEYQNELAKQAKEFAIETALRDVGALNTKAVKALLDTESVKVDGDALLGLDDQLKGLQESDSYLFKQEEKPNTPTIVTGGNPDGGNSAGNDDPFADKLAKYK